VAAHIRICVPEPIHGWCGVHCVHQHQRQVSPLFPEIMFWVRSWQQGALLYCQCLHSLLQCPFRNAPSAPDSFDMHVSVVCYVPFCALLQAAISIAAGSDCGSSVHILKGWSGTPN
jgi:hypothetical protein